MITDNPDAVHRCRARVRSVAELARERAERGVEKWLRNLDRDLEVAQAKGDRDFVELSTRRLQDAMASLNQA